MAKAKEVAEAPTKAAPASTAEQQVKPPEKKAGPAQLFRAQSQTAPLPPPDGSPPLARAGEMVADGGQASAPARARMANAMQGTLGNARLSRMVGATLQAKLMVNEPGDIHEQEADRVAEPVTRKTPGPSQAGKISRVPSGRGAAPVHRAAAGEEKGGATEGVDADMQARIQSPTGGSPVQEGIRRQVEPAMGTDLSHIRVHDSAADRADADHLNAKAFAHGSDIWIGSSGSANDSKLMAHELTHVVQQQNDDGLRTHPTAGIKASRSGDLLEREVESIAGQVASEGPKDFRSISASPARIQRQGDGGQLSNLQRLDEMLIRLFVPEEDVINLLGTLTAAEKATVLAGGYKDRIAAALNVGEMVRAVNNLNPELHVKLEWVRAASLFTFMIDYSDIKATVLAASQADRDKLKTADWRDFFVDVCTNTTMVEALNDLHFGLETDLDWIRAEVIWVRMELDYATIKPFIVAASQADRDKLKTPAWRDFFTEVCTNATMAEAVDDLHWPLDTKLEWMIAEGTDYRLIKPRILAAPAPEKGAVLGNRPLLGSLKDELSWNDFAKSMELLGRQAPTAATLLADPTVTVAMSAAWTDSHPAVPGPGTTQHEEGGWAYFNIITGAITTGRKSSGGQAAIFLGDPPTVDDNIVVGKFHTHPNLGPLWVAGPSPADISVDANHGVPDLIKSGAGDFVSGPAQRLHLAGSQGLPGPAGGDAPQAKRDGSHDAQ